MNKPQFFAVGIEWGECVADYSHNSNNAIVTLPTGQKVKIRRETSRSQYQVRNGPLTFGVDKFFIHIPGGIASFDSFDDLMIRGLKQPMLTKPNW